MKPDERFRVAMSGGQPDRAPVAPKIWIDLAARLTQLPLREVLANPLLSMRVIVDAAMSVGADAARQFLFPPRQTVEENGRLFEVAPNGERIGEIDLEGGLATHRPAEDFVLENPAHVAFRGCWIRHSPFVRSLEDARRIAVPTAEFFRSLGYGDMARQMREYAAGRVELLGDCDTATLAFVEGFRTLSESLQDLIENPALVHALMEKGEQCAIERGRFWLDTGVRVLRINDSVGNMSVISPRHWREFVFPHLKNVCTELHRYCPEAKLYCHICGNVRPILEDLVKAGLDCIAPLDPLGGFSVEQARQIVGNQIVLWGGVNTVSFVRSSPSEISTEALHCLEGGAVDGSRFILGSGCVVPRNARIENLRALVDASKFFAEERKTK